MTILGIDPGTGRCGYAVLSFATTKPQVLTYGCFEFASHIPLPERFVDLEQSLNDLLDAYHPDVLAVETLLFNRNITTAMQVSEARGVIILTGAKRNIPIQDCSPLQVKMSVTGYGRADKNQVKQMVTLQLGLQEVHKLDDALDAIAVAITGYHLFRNKKFVEQA